ncbi:MAG: hypothetical protein JWP13_275 [Candidatus Saccharibacteria bacterium]|nr:hypothetical protein [Candidatus Saccharibacteria bacterium]
MSSSPTAELPDPTPSSNNLHERIQEVVLTLDNTRTQYFDACTQYAEKPEEQEDAVLTVGVGDYRQAFFDFLQVMGMDMDCAQFAHRTFDFLQQEDGQRVDHLNALMGSDKLQKVRGSQTSLDESIEEGLKTLDEESFMDEVLTQTMSYFVNGIEADTSKFRDAMIAKGVSRWPRIRREIGKHAVDVGKMTFAVAAGILISRATGTRQKR